MAKTQHLGISRIETESSTAYTYYNRTFEDIIDLFLYACTHGDYMLVHSLLEDGEVQADVSNRMGKSALQLAIEKEHLEVVKVLLDYIPYEQFRDALLLSIYMGHMKIADFILNHQTYRTFSGGFLDPTNPQAYDDSQFSSDITPLILAAQYNRLLIVHQLLLKGERIKKPHISMCSCKECAEQSASDSFRRAQIRLSAYKGLASEVYIALAYPDPILQAFELSHELRTLAKVEHFFHEEYHKLCEQLAIFVARLIDNVRGHEELEIVLNKIGRPYEEKYETLARFDLAIQYREKAFVAHSNCQQKLMEKWYENLTIIQNANIIKRACFYMIFILCFPLLALIYYFFPKSKIGSLCQQPNLKFKAYITSYFIFICLILASSYFSMVNLEKTKFLSNYNSTIYTNYIQFIYKNEKLKNRIIGSEEISINNTVDSFINCDISLRFMEPHPFQIAIFIWVIGFFWNEFKQIVSIGLRVYLKTPSNYVDCSMVILYVFHFIFLYSSMVCTRVSMATFQSSDYWTYMSRYDTLSDIDKEYYVSKTRFTIYWMNADRFYWKNGDLQNLAEGFFAMGNVVSICRICFLLPIIPFVGPLQVMLDRMIINIAKWLVIMIIFFLAFACALYLLFSFYAVVVQQQNDLTQSSLSVGISTGNNNPSIIKNATCSDYFYEIYNTSIPLIINDEQNDGNTYQDTNDFCQQTSDYSTLVQIGHYPAVYYFGQSFEATLKTTFFTLFGVFGDGTPDRGYELLTASCYKPDAYTYFSGFDNFISNLGFVMYGIFTFICITVLINTLIAMLEETIDDINDRADIEWKFARSKLYMEYIRAGNALPVPFNIFPSPTAVINFIIRIKQMIFSKKSVKNQHKNTQENKDDHSTHINMGRMDSSFHQSARQSADLKMEKIFKRKRSSVSNDHLTYKKVIERIVKRFLLYDKHRSGVNETKDDTEYREVKNDIASFRFEISYNIDLLDDTRTSLIQSMKKFNGNLNERFDIEQLKNYLNR